jgi:hypothetical protein
MKRTTKYVALDVHPATIVSGPRAERPRDRARRPAHRADRAGRIFRGMRSVRPVVEKTYTWRELAEAHRRVVEGRVTGKDFVVSAGRPGAG